MTESLHFKTLPSLTALTLKAGLARKAGLERGETLPAIEATIEGVRLEAKHLDAYRKSCAFADANTLPLPAPHILAAPLHTAILAHSSFPVKAMGLIHARNSILQHRPIPADANLDLVVALGETRWVPKGFEFDILTTATLAGEKVWEEITVVFSRGPVDPDMPPLKATISQTVEGVSVRPEPDRNEIWELAGNLGRRYGAVSGDKNPIHLWPLTAKLFGFKRPIIHGMWTLARCMAAMEDCQDQAKTRMEIRFKRPVFLPGTARFISTQEAAERSFSLETPDREKTYLSGRLVIGDDA